MKILGLNSAGFNTAAALVVDGEVVFAAEEERLIREKRTRKFPLASIRAALDWAGLEFGDLDAVTVAWNPAVNLEAFSGPQSGRARYLGEVLYNVPNHLLQMTGGHQCVHTVQDMVFEDGTRLPTYFVTHHAAHAACYFVSPFDRAAIMTIDAFGEKQSTTFYLGQEIRLEPIWSQDFPHSAASLYSTMTEYLGFTPRSDEWKTMGAGPYGDPAPFYEKVRGLVRLLDDGFELDLNYFNHFQFHRPGMYSPKMVDLLGIPPNPKGTPLEQEHYDLAAATQRVLEEIYFHLLNRLHERTNTDAVVIAGGVALNSVANGKITSQTGFKDVFIPSVPDDSGGSIGSAMYLWNHLDGNSKRWTMKSNYLGPGFTSEEIQGELDRYKIRYETLDDPADKSADLISSGNIIGWFQGRLEFGDRALGNRSILADPRKEEMKDKVNATVKYREPFRPFAPSILANRIDEYFDGASLTPFMEKIFKIREAMREKIPAVTHVDGSGRLQTVTEEQNALYSRLITKFEERTGVPVVLNTSFNLKGEPIVCTVKDALRTFYSSGLDALVVGNFLVVK